MTDLDHPQIEQHAQVLAELGAIVLSSESLNPTLQRIADISVRAVPGVDEASVTLVDGEKIRTVVFTGRLAVDLDERQYQKGFGPCLDAAIGAETVLVDVNDPNTPYAEFAAAAGRLGVSHVMSVGLPVQEQVIGALNLYVSGGRLPDRSTLNLARAFAGYAGVAVANAAQYSDAAQRAEQMRQAMASRAVIEQAKGILMARHRYSSEEAFLELTRLSQHSNRKLRDVAGGLVAAVSGERRSGPGGSGSNRPDQR